MKLEVGSTYKSKSGNTFSILERYSDIDGLSQYEFRGVPILLSKSENNFNIWYWRKDGKFITDDSSDSKYDLIKKIVTIKDDKAGLGNPKDLISQTKPCVSLVPPSALLHLAIAFKEGADKYGAYNWRKDKVKASVYIDAIFRHLLALVDGEDIDPESKVKKHHMDGVIASAAVYIDALESGNLIDDRPPKGTAAQLIRDSSKK